MFLAGDDCSTLIPTWKEQAIEAVQKNGSVLKGIPESHKQDKDILLAALTQNGKALRYVPKPFLRDYDIVHTAVTQNGLALQYASLSLQNNRHIVAAAVNQNGMALQYAYETLQNDEEIIMMAVRQNKEVLIHLNDYWAKKIEVRQRTIHSLKECAKVQRCNVLCLASKIGLSWDDGMKELVSECPDDIEKRDTRFTGLYPFMLVAASSRKPDLDTIYHLIRRSPHLIKSRISSCTRRKSSFYERQKKSSSAERFDEMFENALDTCHHIQCFITSLCIEARTKDIVLLD